MRLGGIGGASRCRGFATTRRDPEHRPADDLVRRNFFDEEPDQLCGAGTTYVPTAAGFLFLAVVLEVWPRLIVGWAMSTDLKTRVVLDALDMALASRRPRDVIYHSDRRSQYTSPALGNHCKEAGVRPSTGSVGDAYDSAMCESFFTTLISDLLDRRRFRSQAEARMAVFQFIEASTIPRATTGPWATCCRSNIRGGPYRHCRPSPEAAHQGGATPTPSLVRANATE